MSGEIKDVTKNYISLLTRQTSSPLGQERIYSFDDFQAKNLSKNKNLDPALWDRMYSDFIMKALKPVGHQVAILRAAPTPKHAQRILKEPLHLEQEVFALGRLTATNSTLRKVHKARKASLLLASRHAPLPNLAKLWKETNLDYSTPAYDHAFLAMVAQYKLLNNDEIASTLALIRARITARPYASIITDVINARPDVLRTLMNHPHADRFARSILHGDSLSKEALTSLLRELYDSPSIPASERYTLYKAIEDSQQRLRSFMQEAKATYLQDPPEGNFLENQLFINSTLTPTLDRIGPEGWDLLLSLANGWGGTLPDLLIAATGAAVR